jgi:hypothetical protein
MVARISTPRKPSKKLAKILAAQSKELATGITSEQLSAMFFDATVLKYQPEPLYRLDSSGHRYYYRYGEDGNPLFYTSVTTLIKATLPTSPHLIKWLIDKGGESGKEEAMERASYGTFLHIQCGELLMTGKYDLDKLQEKLALFLIGEKVPSRDEWIDELKKDVLAFAQFIIDRNVKPIAVEIVLYHPMDMYAGAIDLVCEIDWNKKRVPCIIDIKSGRKGFYESSEIQLGAYRDMWNLHFQDYPIYNIFNWSPKAWAKSPTYNLKDQSDSKNLAKLPYLVSLSKIEADKRLDSVTITKGRIDLAKGLSDNIEEVSYTELIKRNK